MLYVARPRNGDLWLAVSDYSILHFYSLLAHPSSSLILWAEDSLCNQSGINPTMPDLHERSLRLADGWLRKNLRLLVSEESNQSHKESKMTRNPLIFAYKHIQVENLQNLKVFYSCVTDECIHPLTVSPFQPSFRRLYCTVYWIKIAIQVLRFWSWTWSGPQTLSPFRLKILPESHVLASRWCFVKWLTVKLVKAAE